MSEEQSKWPRRIPGYPARPHKASGYQARVTIDSDDFRFGEHGTEHSFRWWLAWCDELERTGVPPDAASVRPPEQPVNEGEDSVEAAQVPWARITTACVALMLIAFVAGRYTNTPHTEPTERHTVMRPQLPDLGDSDVERESDDLDNLRNELWGDGENTALVNVMRRVIDKRLEKKGLTDGQEASTEDGNQ